MTTSAQSDGIVDIKTSKEDQTFNQKMVNTVKNFLANPKGARHLRITVKKQEKLPEKKPVPGVEGSLKLKMIEKNSRAVSRSNKVPDKKDRTSKDKSKNIEKKEAKKLVAEVHGLPTTESYSLNTRKTTAKIVEEAPAIREKGIVSEEKTGDDISPVRSVGLSNETITSAEQIGSQPDLTPNQKP